jgi:predicted MFS family arabinose efflux permease
MAAIFFLLARWQTFIWINGLILLHGILSYAFIPANQAWVLSQVTEAQRVYANNIWRISKNLLISIGFLLNGYLSHINFTMMLDITSLVLLSGGIITSIAKRSQQNRITSPTAMMSATRGKKPHRNPRLYAIYFVLFCIGLIYSQLNSNYPLFLHQFYSISANGYGFLFALNTWLVILLQLPLLYWCRHVSHTYIIAIGALCIGLGMGLLNVGHTWSLAIFSCFVWSLGEILFFSLSEVTLMNYAQEQTKVLFMSLYQFIYSLGAILGPLGGSIIYHFNGGALLWYCCAVLGFFCCGICFSLKYINH